MKVSTRGRYSFLVMISLARNYHNKTYLSLKELSELNNISYKYLEKIIFILNKNKLLDVQRGNVGGYRLNKDPKEYKIGDILRASEGSIAPITCLEGETCLNKKGCLTYNFWNGLYDAINNYVDSYTLEDFIEKRI